MSNDLKKIADILDRAAAHIDAVGWHMGSVVDRDQAHDGVPLTECRVCALGAINMALHGSPLFTAISETPLDFDAHDVADLIAPRRIGNTQLADWNDQDGRTKDEVTAVLRETAAELRGGAAS